MALQAAGSCEAAAASYWAVIEEMAQRRYIEEDRLLGSVDDDNLAFTISQAAEAYAAVADWDGLELFLARLEVYPDKNNPITSGGFRCRLSLI